MEITQLEGGKRKKELGQKGTVLGFFLHPPDGTFSLATRLQAKLTCPHLSSGIPPLPSRLCFPSLSPTPHQPSARTLPAGSKLESNAENTKHLGGVGRLKG